MTHRSLIALAALILALMLALPFYVKAEAPLDLNSAPMVELMKLPGVGPKRAEEIIRWRLTHGFRRREDLLRIKGIGQRTYLKLKPLVEVRPLPPAGVEELRPPVTAPAPVAPAGR
jgi:competence protein ComEA